MSQDKDPTASIRDATRCITEAAVLHLALGEHSTEKSVATALTWRFDISSYAAGECYVAALKLMDAMPRGRR